MADAYPESRTIFKKKKTYFPVEIIFRLETALLKRGDDKLSLMVENDLSSRRDFSYSFSFYHLQRLPISIQIFENCRQRPFIEFVEMVKDRERSQKGHVGN